MSAHRNKRRKIDITNVPIGVRDFHGIISHKIQFYIGPCVGDRKVFIGPRKNRHCRLCYDEFKRSAEIEKKRNYIKAQFDKGRREYQKLDMAFKYSITEGDKIFEVTQDDYENKRKTWTERNIISQYYDHYTGKFFKDSPFQRYEKVSHHDEKKV